MLQLCLGFLKVFQRLFFLCNCFTKLMLQRSHTLLIAILLAR